MCGVYHHKLVEENVSIQPTPSLSWSRGATVQTLVAFEAAQAQGTSQRAFAEAMHVPRTTLQRWLARQARLDASPALVAFLESSAGLELLHRLVWALMFVLCFVAGLGVRPVREVLRLTGLGPFLAMSHGYLNQLERQMAAEIVTFDRQARTRLAAQMKARLDAGDLPARPITACLDENFHDGRPCLVAIEPVSNFILVEAHASKRDVATWAATMAPVLAALPVQIVQGTSDEGKAVVAYTRTTLNANHSPDVFHLQREVSRTMSAPLARQVVQAIDAHTAAQAATEARRTDAAAQRPRHRGRPFDYARRLAQAEAVEQAAHAAVEAAQRRQEQARQARRGLSLAYHLVDLQTGRLRTPDEVEQALTAHFDTLQAVTAEAGLPDYSRKGLAKARRVLPALTQTLVFVHLQLATQVATWRRC